jgi:hypothetical protein
MRDKYFSMYQTLKFKEFYYTVHEENATKKMSYYSFTMFAISIISVLAWSISLCLPAIWAILIASAQFAQAIKDYFPWQKQIIATNFLVPELKNLSSDVEAFWLQIDIKQYDNDTIQKQITTFEKRYVALENQFTNGVHFSDNNKLIAIINNKYDTYFYSKFSEFRQQ